MTTCSGAYQPRPVIETGVPLVWAFPYGVAHRAMRYFTSSTVFAGRGAQALGEAAAALRLAWRDRTSPGTGRSLGVWLLLLATAAWVDLAVRPAARVNGRKDVWAAVIGINFVGPIAYFARGRRPRG